MSTQEQIESNRFRNLPFGMELITAAQHPKSGHSIHDLPFELTINGTADLSDNAVFTPNKPHTPRCHF